MGTLRRIPARIEDPLLVRIPRERAASCTRGQTLTRKVTTFSLAVNPGRQYRNPTLNFESWGGHTLCHACTYVRGIFVYTHKYMHICMYVCTYVCMYARMYVCVHHVCVCVCMCM